MADKEEQKSESIAYVTHPMSAEQKKKLRSEGYSRILDARFAPKGEKIIEGDIAAAEAKKSKPKDDKGGKK